MKKLLVPTDFSEHAENALRVAVEIAKKRNSEIYLLHSIELPVNLATGSSEGGLPQSLFYMKLAEKRFSEFRKRDYLKDIVIHETVGLNEIYKDIDETCKNNNIDLIVMGSSGASGFKEMFVGSNTEKVVRTSDVPVLVIKNDQPHFEIKDFVFATDFSDQFRGPFTKAKAFAEDIGAKIHLLLVNTPANFQTSTESYALMENFINGMELKNYTLNVHNDTSVEKGILNFANFINAQLIGMGTHGRKGISHFLNGSISEDMVNHINMPIITFKI